MKSKFTINNSPVYINDNLTAKMEGVPTISTSPLENPHCQKRVAETTARGIDCVCRECFSIKTNRRYKALDKHMRENTVLLSGSVLPLEDLPIFGNVRFVRFEAFGDLVNDTHLLNFLNIARVNPFVTFTLFTKNAFILHHVFKGLGIEKPSNLIIIFSSPRLNVAMLNALDYPYIDKIFTVYTPDFLEFWGYDESNFINCGSRSCVACGRCYRKDSEAVISERLK